MLRGDNVVSGTSSTGTGTLTLAACPSPPGGIDFDVYARAVGFGNSAAVPVSYTIIEYTDTSFAVAKKTEKGAGILTLGSSSGIANCTLTRTTIQTTATNMNTSAATQNIGGTAVSIGVAANTLVFMGVSALDVAGYEPWTQSDAIPPPNNCANPTGNIYPLAGDGSRWVYQAFEWRIPLLAKRFTMGVWAGFTSGNSNLYAAIYAIGSNGLPGKRLIDFGLVGTANASLNTAFVDISSGLHSTGYFMTPGEYYLGIAYTLQNAYATGSLVTYPSPSGQRMNSARWSILNHTSPVIAYTDQGGTFTPAPDPAYVTGLTTVGGDNYQLSFWLGNT